MRNLNSISSANQPAKDLGIERGPEKSPVNLDMDPHVRVLRVPQKYGKPEILSLKKAKDNIMDCVVAAMEENYLLHNCNSNITYKPCVQLTHGDELFLDLTHEVDQRKMSNTLVNSLKMEENRKFIIDLEHKQLVSPEIHTCAFAEITKDDQLLSLLHGAEIVAKILDVVKQKLGFVISAGIGENKVLAKLACQRGKPNGLAVLPTAAFPRVQGEMPFSKIPGLGGMTGEMIKESTTINTIRDFCKSYHSLCLWTYFKGRRSYADSIYEKANGKDNDPVIRKYFHSKIGCGKSLNTCEYINECIILQSRRRINIIP